MADRRDPEKADYVVDAQKTSSSSSESSSGSTTESTPPSTPPEDEQEAEGDALPRIQHSPHSSNPPRRGNRRARNSPSTRLGAIDEDSSQVAPDIPTRNPNRRLVGLTYSNAAKLFGFGAASFKDSDVPPPDAYDQIVGPRGEKFSDLRHNKPYSPPGKAARRRKLCLGVVIILILATALAVGLGVGLTRQKRASSNNSENNSPSTPSPSSEQFPIGTYSIPVYLATQATNCTSNPATWRCYPYTTYSPSSPSSSFSMLLWSITSPTDSTLNLLISNTNPSFSYPFTNVSLTLSNGNDPRLSAFTFTFSYRKQVVPTVDIAGDGSATRCYFDNTQVNVRLYSTAQGAGGNVVGPPNGVAHTGQTWPYAIEFVETEGGAPQCFRVVNGQETTNVSVPALSGGQCACAYRNYGLF